jgi:hypothetical protein
VQQAAMQIPISPNASNRRAFNPSRSSKRDIDAVEQFEKVDSRLTGDHTVNDERPGWNADTEPSSNPSAASNVPAPLARRKRMTIESMCTEGDRATAELGSDFTTFSASSSNVHLENGPTINNTREAGQDYEMQLLLLEMQSIKRCRMALQYKAAPSPSSETLMNSPYHLKSLTSLEPDNDKYFRANQADKDFPPSSFSSAVGGHRLQDYQNALIQHEESRRSQTLSPTTEVGNATPPPPSQPLERHISSDQQSTPWEQEIPNRLGQYHQGEQQSVVGAIPRIPQTLDYQTSTSSDSNQEMLAQAQQQKFQLQQARLQADAAYEQRLIAMEQKNKARMQALAGSRKLENHNPNLPRSNHPVKVDYSYELKQLEQENKARREAERRESENHNPNLQHTNNPVKVDYSYELLRVEQQNKSNYVSYEQEMKALEQKNKARREAARRESENHNPNLSQTNYSVKVDYQQELEELVEQNKRRRMMKQNGMDRQQANPKSSTAGQETSVDESEDLEAIETQIQMLQKKADRLRSLKRSHAASMLQ